MSLIATPQKRDTGRGGLATTNVGYTLPVPLEKRGRGGRQCAQYRPLATPLCAPRNSSGCNALLCIGPSWISCFDLSQRAGSYRDMSLRLWGVIFMNPRSQRNWAAYRSQIEDLYWHHKTKLPEVMKTMKEVHGFDANAKSYKRNFKAWGLEKNLKREESIAMLGIAERRRRMENKETIFYCRGKIVDPVKLRRFAKRHKLNDAGLTASLRAATPPNISQRPLQQAGNTLDDGLGYSNLDLPNSYTADADYGVVDSVPFGDTSPAYGATGASNMASASGYTTLHHAVIGNDIQAAEAMLCFGSSSNTPSCNGITPLHCAAYQRNPNMVRLLLEHGASLDATTDENRSILFFAVRGHSQSDSSDLLIYGSPTMTRSGSPTDDDTLRIIDALFNFPTRWNRLSCSLNKPDKAGVTPLMVAAGEGFVKTASWLLERGAVPDLRDHTDNTALKYAAKNYHRDMVRLLLLADKGISYERRPSHILKLASKNILMSQVQAEDEQGIWQNSYHASPATLIAEEIVRLCREIGLLDELLDLANRKRKVHLLELFQRAARELDRETSCSNGS
ncbi:hypothetical protein VTI28DRAFT_1061 [Corynascus sepedonium]